MPSAVSAVDQQPQAEREREDRRAHAACVAVVAQEDLLEVVVAAADRAHVVGGERLDQRVGRALEGDQQVRAVDVASRTPGSARSSPLGGHGAREHDLQPLHGDRPKVLERVDGDQAPAPQDRDAVGDPLDLRQRVRGEEDRPPLRDDLPEQRVEALLHQRVEPGDRLVEDQQLRLVHERLDQPELLAVARRELVHGAVQLRVEALRQRVADPAVDSAAQLGEEVEHRRAGQLRVAARGRRAGSRRGAGSRGCRARLSRPSTRAEPDVGRIWSSSRRIVVDLPAPLGPRKPKHLAVPDTEVEPEQAVAAAEVLRQPARADRELAAHRPKPSAALQALCSSYKNSSRNSGLAR